MISSATSSKGSLDDDPEYTPYTYKEKNLDKNWEAYSQDPNLIWMERISTS